MPKSSCSKRIFLLRKRKFLQQLREKSTCCNWIVSFTLIFRPLTLKIIVLKRSSLFYLIFFLNLTELEEKNFFPANRRIIFSNFHVLQKKFVSRKHFFDSRWVKFVWECPGPLSVYPNSFFIVNFNNSNLLFFQMDFSKLYKKVKKLINNSTAHF